MPLDQPPPAHLPPAPPPPPLPTAPIPTTLAAPAVTAGSLASRTIRSWWKNLGRFTAVMLVVYLPIMVVAMAAAIIIPNSVKSGARGEDLFPIMAGVLAIALLVAFPLMATLMGGMSYGVIEHLAGRRPGVGAMLGQGFRRIWPLTLCTLLVWLAVLGGYILLIVPGIMLAIATSLALPAATVEALGPVAAFKRSLDLTRGYRWSLLGAFLLVVVLQFAVNMVGNLMGLIHPVVGVVVSLVVVIPVGALPMLTPAVAYHDLRLAKEGVDTSALARVFD